MSTGTKDTVKGVAHQVKGKLKELAGKATNNPTLRAKGVAEGVAGKAQRKLADVKKVLGRR